MKIKIVHTWDGKYIPKVKWLFFWINISEYDGFSYENACINFAKEWVRKRTKSKRVHKISQEIIYEFKPDYRSQIDIDFN